MLFPCRCRLDLDGVAVLTLLLDLALILFSGSDLVFSEILDPSVLALSPATSHVRLRHGVDAYRHRLRMLK